MKGTLRCHLTPIIVRNTENSVGEDVEKLGPCALLEMQSGVAAEEQCGGSSKNKNRVVM